MVLAGTISSPPSLSRSSSSGAAGNVPTIRRLVQRPVMMTTAIARRPPILMEFTDAGCLYFGLVGDAKPKHVLPYDTCSSSSSSSILMSVFGTGEYGNTTTLQEDTGDVVVGHSMMRQSHVSVGAWYRTLSPLLQQVYHALGPDGKERRVVVLLPPHVAIPCSSSSSSSAGDSSSCPHLIVPTNFKAALLQCLLQNNTSTSTNDANAAAASSNSNSNSNNNINVSLQCSMTLVPYALPMIATAMLLVHVGLRDVSCMIHAAGYSLPFTFQTIPVVVNNMIMMTDTDNKDHCNDDWLNEITFSLLKCLQACPRAARQAAIHNIVCFGAGVIGSGRRFHVSLLVVRRLQHVLRVQSLDNNNSNNKETMTDGGCGAAAAAGPVVVVAKEEKRQHDDEDDNVAEPQTILYHGLGVIPVNLQELQPLAEHVGLIDYVIFPEQQQQQQDELQQQQQQRRRYRPRPDLLAWTGASLWASHWHNRAAENEAQFHWIGK
jgi:hypothetical protein